MTTLRCRCGIEVGIVRLNADTLALGHRVNPRNNRHPVRLAPAAAVSSSREDDGVPQRQPEGPNGSSPYPNERVAPATSGLQVARRSPRRRPLTHRPALASGAGSEGTPVLTAPMPVDSRQSGQGVASLIPPAIRPAPTAGD